MFNAKYDIAPKIMDILCNKIFNLIFLQKYSICLKMYT